VSRRVLVAGVGNLLRRDDGFGPVVADRLAAEELPPGVKVIETGIGGVALVQELMDRYDAVLVLDAARRGERPGTLSLLEPELPDLHAWTPEARHAFLANLHEVEPSGALTLAAALGVLPPVVRLLVCEPADCDEAEIGLTPVIEHAATLAVERARRLMDELASDRLVGATRASPAVCATGAA
jgi:hydrogenase maturation protease